MPDMLRARAQLKDKGMGDKRSCTKVSNEYDVGILVLVVEPWSTRALVLPDP